METQSDLLSKMVFMENNWSDHFKKNNCLGIFSKNAVLQEGEYKKKEENNYLGSTAALQITCHIV